MKIAMVVFSTNFHQLNSGICVFEDDQEMFILNAIEKDIRNDYLNGNEKFEIKEIRVLPLEKIKNVFIKHSDLIKYIK